MFFTLNIKHAFRRWLFRMVFGIAYKNTVEPEHDQTVIILDQENRNPVWIARYNQEDQSFEASTGWFERSEVTLWTPMVAVGEVPPLRQGRVIEREYFLSFKDDYNFRLRCSNLSKAFIEQAEAIYCLTDKRWVKMWEESWRNAEPPTGDGYQLYTYPKLIELGKVNNVHGLYVYKFGNQETKNAFQACTSIGGGPSLTQTPR